MKTALTATGLGAVITAVAAAGQPALALVGILVLTGIGAVCWMITNRDRTANAVAIINAARGRPAGPAEPTAKIEPTEPGLGH
jgi:hypothetical protein